VCQDAAGVSPRTVFRPFATRDALFVEVIRAGVRRYAEQPPPPWLTDAGAVQRRRGYRARFDSSDR
jgi:hypothetical protein